MTEWAEKSLLDKITDRLTQLEGKMDRFKSARDNITRYFRRDLHWEVEANSKHGFLGDEIYEGTAPWAARIAATCFMGLSTAKNTPWLIYEMDEFSLRGIDRLDQWCQDIRDHQTAVYRKSNFYDVMPEFSLDAWTIGSPVMFGEEIILEEKIAWLPQYYNNVFMSYDKFNRPNGVIVRDKRWTAQQIADTFCGGLTPETRKKAREDKLSIGLNKALDSGQYNDEYTIIRAVFRVDDGIWDGGKFKKPVNPRSQWLSVEFEDGTLKKDKPLRTSGYFTRPFVTWDFNKKVYDACSITPAYEAIWDVLSSQQMYKSVLENAQLQNMPPLISLSTMKNHVNALVGGENWVTDLEYDRPPKRLDVIGDIQLTRDELQLLDEKVKRHFHIPEFIQATQLAQTNKQPITALQFWSMMGERSTQLSPVIETNGRFLSDIDERVMSIEFEAHRGPFDLRTMGNITDIVVENSKKISRNKKGVSVGISPKFVGALYQAQKVQQVVEPIVRGLQTMAPIFAEFPETKYIIKPYKLIDKLAGATDFPMDIINTEEDWQVIIDGIQKQAAQDKQAAMAIEMAKVSPNISGKVDKESILGNMAGANAQ